MSRDFGYYWLRLIIYIVVTLCIGTIYLNVGTGYSSILVKSLLLSRHTFSISYGRSESICLTSNEYLVLKLVA
jgi:hypothetical protein